MEFSPEKLDFSNKKLLKVEVLSKDHFSMKNTSTTPKEVSLTLPEESHKYLLEVSPLSTTVAPVRNVYTKYC